MGARPLEGRVALVTGASRGIGRMFTTWLIEAGVHVALCARNAENLEPVATDARGAGVDVLTDSVDVADVDAVDTFVQRTVDRFGRVDFAIANAAILGPVGSIDAVDPKEWANTLQIDVMGTMALARAVIPHMRAAGWGRIITMSGAGAGGPNLPDRVSAYVASKGAVMMLTEVLAKELPDGVTINSIAPGAFPTGFMQEVIDQGRDVAGDALFESVQQQARDKGTDVTPLHDLLMYLVSDASAWCTGRCLSVRWDPPSALQALALSGDVDESRWRLRRIDEDLFGTRSEPS